METCVIGITSELALPCLWLQGHPRDKQLSCRQAPEVQKVYPASLQLGFETTFHISAPGVFSFLYFSTDTKFEMTLVNQII